MAPSDNLLRRANALGRHVRATRLAGSLLGLILAAALGLGLLLGLSAAGAPWAVRTGAALLAAGVVLGGLVRTAWLVRASLPPQRAAALVERRFPELQDRFVTAVELALSPPGGDGRAAPTGSPVLAGRVAEQAEQAISGLDLRQAVDVRPVRRLAVVAVVAALALGLSAALYPRAWAGMLRRPERPATAGLPPERPPTAPPVIGPSLADVSLRLEYPAYTSQPAETRTTDLELVPAPAGTQVTVQATVRGAGATAALVLDRAERELVVAEARVQSTFTLTDDVTWQLRATDRAGRTMLTPACRLRVLADRAPIVALSEPGPSETLPEPRAVRLVYRAEDDWGLTGLSLEYRGPEDGAWQTVPLSTGGGRVVSDAWSWDLRPLRLARGQGVTFRLAARDNDAVSGPKTTRTPAYTITIGAEASLAASPPAAATEAASDAEGEGLEELEQEAQELGRQLDEVIAAADKGTLTAEERERRAAELGEAQRRVAEQADRVSRALTESERQAELEQLAPTLQEKLRELHDLLQQTMNEDLAEALRQIEQALRNADPAELQQGLQNARQSQQAFSEQLQQAIELLKRARLERNLARAADEAQRLAADQARLNQERAAADKARQQAGRQQQVGDRERALEGALAELAREARPLDQQAAERLDRVGEQLQAQGTQQSLQQAAQRLQQGDPAGAAPAQEQALNDLNQAATGLRQLQADMSAGSQQQMSRAAQEMTRDALYLSREQERALRDTEALQALNARSAAQGKQQREGLRRRQEALEGGARELGAKLAEAARQTPQVDPSLASRAERIADEMGRAGREAAAGAGPQAAQTQRQAMSELNALAQQLIRTSESLQQAGQRQGLQALRQQLQALSLQQQGLNEQTSQAQGRQPRPRGSRGQLADAQQRIRDALQRLLQRAGRQSGLPDQLGDVPGTMEDIERDLREDRLGAQTAERQRQVLHRMLDAQRSVYQRDQQRHQRVAERPKPFRLPPSPPELTPRNPPPAQPGAAPTEEAGLPLDFEDLVRQYYRALAAR